MTGGRAVACYLVSESTITAGWMTWAQVATLTIPQPSAFRTSVGMPAGPFRISLSVPGTLPLSGIADPFPCVSFQLWPWSMQLGRSVSRLDGNKLSSPHCPHVLPGQQQKGAYRALVLYKARSSFFSALIRNSYCAFL